MRISIFLLNRAEEDVMELLWQNGPVVLHNQNQRSLKKSQLSFPADQSAPREIPSSHHHQQEQQDHLFMQEYEMASWLHYPLNDTNFDSDFCTDLLYPAPCITSTTTTTATATATPPVRATHVTDSRPQLNTATTVASAPPLRPPIPPPPRRTENFGLFARHMPREVASGPSNSKSVTIRESTVVDSSDTPAPGPDSRASEAMRSMEGASGVNNNNRCRNTSGAGAAATSSGGGGGSSGARDLTMCEMTVTSSPGGSSASAEPPAQKPAAEDRKRKGREIDDEYHSEVKSAYHYFYSFY